ncbi:cytochrome P450 monooxygenase-like protein [Dendryphion nanum]|uniref:Cytochrome P450 monooxygenase-like protein n=1 Tax=Dendryphion nanum TaxID=256645 RepID=A0A9P9IG93_9PLEO|nr:cytochrome P450 monooxygenase-like protein [Dendryphion nanum]
MALHLVLGTVAIVVLYHLFGSYRNLLRNIAEAKRSGLPYVVIPWHVHSVFWLATNQIWIALLQRLPARYRGLWLEISDPEWCYRVGHKPYKELGSDVFLTVSPSTISAFVADAEAITQITTRRNDFPKPLHLYGRLDIYGKNVVSTEGSDWRVHRKLTAPTFGDRNNQLVFLESVHHAKSLLRLWNGPDGSGNKTVLDPAMDTMRFALYVISRAGFDVRVLWPHEEGTQLAESNNDTNSLFMGSKPPPGHEMGYREALGDLLHNIVWTQIGPPQYLTKSPFKIHRQVGKAVIEWGKYMEFLFDRKKEEVLSGQNSKEGMDIFQALIRGSGILSPDSKSTLQKSDILGNAFVMMLAGHETTANALHYSLLFLAQNWQSQKRLQEDIDHALQGKPVSQWTYEDDFPKLFNGMAAAVMNETLRLLQPIINIPKSTAKNSPQSLNIKGQQYIIPGGSQVYLSCAVHRNPRYWPAPVNPPSPEDDPRPDTDRFRPERWLESAPTEAFVDINYDDEELRGPSGEDTSASLFKPVKGSYIPFSDGYRSCIGRRFAQVEILAVLAVIFSQYSVELAVDEWASDEEVERMPKGGKERKELWTKATTKCDHLLKFGMNSIITLQLRGGNVPIRIVRRGEEKFVFE